MTRDDQRTERIGGVGPPARNQQITRKQVCERHSERSSGQLGTWSLPRAGSKWSTSCSAASRRRHGTELVRAATTVVCGSKRTGARTRMSEKPSRMSREVSPTARCQQFAFPQSRRLSLRGLLRLEPLLRLVAETLDSLRRSEPAPSLNQLANRRQRTAEARSYLILALHTRNEVAVAGQQLHRARE